VLGWGDLVYLRTVSMIYRILMVGWRSLGSPMGRTQERI
jgi:hypothetical protein